MLSTRALKSMYRKLRVGSQSERIERARSLGGKGDFGRAD